jgi:pilus assembly protein CpaE
MTADVTLSVLVLGGASRAAAEVRRLLESLPGLALASETTTFDDGVHALRARPRDAILVVEDGDAARAHAVIEEISRHAPLAEIFALSPDIAPDAVIRARRAGATECLALPLDAALLEKALVKVTAIKRMAEPNATTQGEIWTVVSPKVGVGATTLVANLGIELRTGLGRDVVLVDLDFHCAELALFLNLHPPYSLHDIALDFKRLDAVFLHGALVRHPSGLCLLAALPESAPAASGMAAEHLRGVLDLLRARYEIVIVDAPPPFSEVTVAALGRSDRVIVPTELTIPCLRAARRTLSMLRDLDVHPKHLDVVATKYAPHQTDITLAEVRDTLRFPLSWALPRDDDAACGAVNKGLSLAEVHGASPLRAAIVNVAQDLTGANQSLEPGTRGVLQRLLSA